MPLKESYVIWNNKGGVGKTTLAFHMATEFSRRNPTIHVLVIDLCPQANVSLALLSSNAQEGGEGSVHLSNLCQQQKTVSFYLQRSLAPGPAVRSDNFIVKVDKYNHQVPGNLFLLCGDINLELVCRNLDHVRQGASNPWNNPWVNVTTLIRSFIEGSRDTIIGVAESSDFEWVVFIDTNPSFSVYTEIAIAAARRLIIPINADDFSVEAVKAMLDMVYGIKREEGEGEVVEGEIEDPFIDYRKFMFCYKAKEFNLPLPKIYLMINNRTTTKFTRSVKAFSDMGEKNSKVMFDAYRRHPECFYKRQEDEKPITDINTFKEHFFANLRDFHTTAILSIYTGCPLGALCGKVKLYEVEIKVDRTQVTAHLECLQQLVQRL